MEYPTEEQRLEQGLCPKCETDLVKACRNGGHPDDKTSECPKCNWRDFDD